MACFASNYTVSSICTQPNISSEKVNVRSGPRWDDVGNQHAVSDCISCDLLHQHVWWRHMLGNFCGLVSALTTDLGRTLKLPSHYNTSMNHDVLQGQIKRGGSRQGAPAPYHLRTNWSTLAPPWFLCYLMEFWIIEARWTSQSLKKESKSQCWVGKLLVGPILCYVHSLLFLELLLLFWGPPLSLSPADRAYVRIKHCFVL